MGGRTERPLRAVAGVPVRMLPEPVVHVRLKYQVWAALDRAIRAAGLDCEALGDGITVEVGDDTDYEPDAVVNGGPPVHPDAFAAALRRPANEVTKTAAQVSRMTRAGNPYGMMFRSVGESGLR